MATTVLVHGDGRSAGPTPDATGPAAEPTTRREDVLEDAGKLLLRVVVGGLMLFHGVDKLVYGLAGIRADLAGAGLPAMMAWGVYAGEVVAPLLILAGIWTRPAGVLYGVTVLFATLLVHARSYVSLLTTGAWAAETYVFYILGAVTVSLLGAGRYSIRHGSGRWD